MSNARTLTAAIVLAVLCAGPASAQKVKLEYDQKADFSKYKTYAWIQGSPAREPIWNAVIVGSVDTNLQGKGLRLTDVKDADLLVSYHAASDSQLDVSFAVVPYYSSQGGAPPPAGGTGAWYGGTLGSTARYVKKGALAVHLLDRQSQVLVWASTAQGAVEETGKKKLAQLNKVFQKIFSDYPPKPKKKS